MTNFVSNALKRRGDESNNLTKLQTLKNYKLKIILTLLLVPNLALAHSVIEFCYFIYVQF